MSLSNSSATVEIKFEEKKFKVPCSQDEITSENKQEGIEKGTKPKTETDSLLLKSNEKEEIKAYVPTPKSKKVEISARRPKKEFPDFSPPIKYDPWKHAEIAKEEDLVMAKIKKPEAEKEKNLNKRQRSLKRVQQSDPYAIGNATYPPSHSNQSNNGKKKGNRKKSTDRNTLNTGNPNVNSFWQDQISENYSSSDDCCGCCLCGSLILTLAVPVVIIIKQSL